MLIVGDTGSNYEPNVTTFHCFKSTRTTIEVQVLTSYHRPRKNEKGALSSVGRRCPRGYLSSQFWAHLILDGVKTTAGPPAVGMRVFS
jgi:hypothetical protein